MNKCDVAYYVMLVYSS